jgi:ketosteroid isomerase-like protein
MRGDVSTLERVLADDFVGVGPRGFMLNKEEWIQRYKSGELKHQSFKFDDVKTRLYTDAAVLVGLERAKGTYQGHELQGDLRATLVMTKQQERWRIVGIHLSPIAGPLPSAL